MSWKLMSNYKDIHKGDMVKGVNFTHSQKYIDLEGYEYFNQTRIGEVISENHQSFFDIKIRNDEGLEEFLVYDCGNSGEWYVYVDVEKKDY